MISSKAGFRGNTSRPLRRACAKRWRRRPAGFPLVDIKVTLLDGSFHEVDSSEIAFKIAAAMALRAGCKKASPTIFEPIMRFEVTTPEQYMGDVIGDLNSRRARIMDMGNRSNIKFVKATVPLSELFGYATVVRSISQGRAAFTMEPSHYEEVPSNVRKAIVEKGPETATRRSHSYVQGEI